jgi:hypothetical protein
MVDGTSEIVLAWTSSVAWSKIKRRRLGFSVLMSWHDGNLRAASRADIKRQRFYKIDGVKKEPYRTHTLVMKFYLSYFLYINI